VRTLVGQTRRVVELANLPRQACMFTEGQYFLMLFVECGIFNARGSGFEPRQGQGFSSSYETPELLGAGDSHVLRMRR
jgi:hypothetical protein